MANNNAPAPIFRDYNAKDLVQRVDPDHNKPADVYQFSNGRTFKDPEGHGGPYKQP